MKDLIVKSTAFENNQLIPVQYTCDGDEVNPPLTIAGTPEETRSLVLIVDDPDAPAGTWDHWVVWNIPSTTTKIAENTVPGVEGKNTARTTHLVLHRGRRTGTSSKSMRWMRSLI